MQSIGIETDKCCYLGEVIIDENYRGLKISSQLIEMQETHFKEKGFLYASFLTVVRDENHPLSPENYTKPDAIWQKLGYQKTSVTTEFAWPVIQFDGDVVEEKNEMVFWVKGL